MSLPTLPTELLSCIATLLLPSIQDVDSLAKTSKRLYAITNPILYHHHIFHQDSSALIWAAQHGKTDACNRLLQEGANPNTQDPHLQTPLIWAAGHGRPASTFWTWFSPTPTTTESIHPKAGNYLAIVKLLLSAKDIQPDCRAQRGATPLTAAATAGAEEIVEELLRTGKVDANTKNKFGQTPLHAAARHGHFRIVQRLLAVEGVDADAQSEGGMTPLLAAAAAGHARIVKLLLAIPTVDPDQQPSFGDRALLTAILAGHTDVVEALLANEKVSLSLPNKYGITALATAAKRGHPDIIRWLLAKGVDPDVKDREGMTPLMFAAERGHVEAAELLLSTGRVQADFDLTTMNRSFGFAPSKLNKDVVRLLDDYKSRRRGGSLLDS
jgi:ankyrin repeat protein